MSEKKIGTAKTIEDRVTVLEKRASTMSRILDKVRATLEKMYKIDFNADGKIGVLAFCLTLAVAGIAMAATMTIVDWDNAARTGSAKIAHDGTDYTLTVDNVAAEVSTVQTKSTTSITANTTITSAHYGKVLLVQTNAAVTLTLPANGAVAGAWLEVMPACLSATVKVSDSCAPTIAAATADTLIGPNDVDLDSVTFATTHRIGARVQFVSDGYFWHAVNLGSTTMTGTD